MKNEWEWHGEKEGEEGRAKENREKSTGWQGLLEKDTEEDRSRDKGRGQEPCETRRTKASREELGWSRRGRF